MLAELDFATTGPICKLKTVSMFGDDRSKYMCCIYIQAIIHMARIAWHLLMVSNITDVRSRHQ